MAEGAVFSDITIFYSLEWLANDTQLSGLDRADVDVSILTEVFERGLAAFVDAEEGVHVSVKEDASIADGCDILIDGERPSDGTDDKKLEYNVEKAFERYIQLGAFWDEYRDRIG